jgi:hypothetical protein
VRLVEVDGEGGGANLAPAQAVDAAVAREAEQPGEEGLAVLEAVEPGVDAEEDLLRGVPGLFAFAQEVQRHAEDPPLILPDERLPGEVVALATAFDQGVGIQQALPPVSGSPQQAAAGVGSRRLQTETQAPEKGLHRRGMPGASGLVLQSCRSACSTGVNWPRCV